MNSPSAAVAELDHPGEDISGRSDDMLKVGGIYVSPFEVEGALMLHGWSTTHHDAYDQRYYRKWMHELPPLKHNTRGTVLDVHHAILPVTARLKPDSRKLLAASRPIAAPCRPSWRR